MENSFELWIRGKSLCPDNERFWPKMELYTLEILLDEVSGTSCH